MSTLIEVDGKKILLLKGASEIVLESCGKWMHESSGEILNLD